MKSDFEPIGSIKTKLYGTGVLLSLAAWGLFLAYQADQFDIDWGHDGWLMFGVATIMVSPLVLGTGGRRLVYGTPRTDEDYHREKFFPRYFLFLALAASSSFLADATTDGSIAEIGSYAGLTALLLIANILMFRSHQPSDDLVAFGSHIKGWFGTSNLSSAATKPLNNQLNN